MSTFQRQAQQAKRYAERIRNAGKRAYAAEIIAAEIAGEAWPAYPREISYMAGQAVHMELSEIFAESLQHSRP